MSAKRCLDPGSQLVVTVAGGIGESCGGSPQTVAQELRRRQLGRRGLRRSWLSPKRLPPESMPHSVRKCAEGFPIDSQRISARTIATRPLKQPGPSTGPLSIESSTGNSKCLGRVLQRKPGDEPFHRARDHRIFDVEGSSDHVESDGKESLIAVRFCVRTTMCQRMISHLSIERSGPMMLRGPQMPSLSPAPSSSLILKMLEGMPSSR